MSNVFMLPTQKSWDALDANGCLNGLEVMSSGKMIQPPKRIPFLQMPDESYKVILRDMGLIETDGELL